MPDFSSKKKAAISNMETVYCGEFLSIPKKSFLIYRAEVGEYLCLQEYIGRSVAIYIVR